MSSTTPKWVTYTLVNSILCITGGLMVPVISILFRTKKNINTKLINYGLSLSAGSMITTSLYKMLPRMDGNNNIPVFVAVSLGIFISFSVNYLVHSYASESLLHCAHENNDQDHVDEGDHSHSHDHLHDNTSPENRDDSTKDNRGQYSQAPADNIYTDISEVNDMSNNDQSTDAESSPLLSNNTRRTNTSATITKLFTKNGATTNSEECVPIIKTKSFSCYNGSQAEGIVSKHIQRSTSLSFHLTNGSEFNSENRLEAGKLHSKRIGLSCLENDVGYDLENLPTYRHNFLKKKASYEGVIVGSNMQPQSHSYATQSESATSGQHSSTSVYSAKTHKSHLKDHHHKLETPFSKLLSIGLQTCLVLTIHKLPEGFIIYYTNRSNESSELGLSIFISLAIHNFVEGFAMTLPFYAALESKGIPILITAVLGGGSQPIGALIGYLFFRNKEGSDLDGSISMDFFLSLTAGFLLVIALQMFQTGVGFSDNHHHHGDDDDSETIEEHSLGTTCLKWSCFGVLLILASGIFV
ncbi:hypothetical protein TPHA_0A02730 [Tetrapisispora phaffii CBS 4417]|uniref:Zinc/iron permease n=1 Tax=Tetrapisispora phaffii (strain ATCC 24235 / CBS 4417 / NBRC 1672 / NRRL Y-8282 / UCD 70-5) TaxID=1071381 RepID=G8BN77_TETPH|nr:hypothetical protein TPHA_0A02730 [Tetrapisispora phaffii CBS 4417]CCE61355.1 hypothetical protein TPHA_0A02730 [Tetrapisispora phaffii CBS 4417]